MTFPSLRRAVLPLVLVLLAGCGTQASKKVSSSPTAASTPSSVSSGPTAVVTGGSVAATVNGRAVPMSTFRVTLDFDRRQYSKQPGMTTKTIGTQAMNQIVGNEVVKQYAAAHHISVSSAEINQEIKDEQTRAGGQAKFQAELTKAGLTMDQYKTILLQPGLLTRKVANQLFPIHMTQVEGARVWHILIATKPQGKPPRTDAKARSLAEDILHQVRQGADFAGLARQYSDDPGSAQQGGDLGNVTRGQTVPPFDKAVFSAPLNKPVLVHSRFGYHIVEVISRGKVSQPSQADQQAQQQKFFNWQNAQIKKATVKRIAQVK